jgi:hypothetical protein
MPGMPGYIAPGTEAEVLCEEGDEECIKSTATATTTPVLNVTLLTEKYGGDYWKILGLPPPNNDEMM